jgi:phage terminase large subunit-like protein
MDEFDVVWMFADPAYWQDIVGRWSLDYPDVVHEFWTHRRALMCKAIERFETAVLTGQLRYSSDPAHEVLGRHVLNAHVDETPSGRLIRKEFPQSSRKIDTAMAAVLAFEARAAAVEDGRSEDSSDNTIYSF